MMRSLAFIVGLLFISSPSMSGNLPVYSPRAFVQSFYNWYVPRQLSSHSGPAWMSAIHERRDLFSPELRIALENDSAASKRSKNVINGLDFDPFLNSQDPEMRYSVGVLHNVGKKTLVDVCAMMCDVEHRQPDVIVVLSHKDGRWTFSDFFYPDQHQGLMATLKELRIRR